MLAGAGITACLLLFAVFSRGLHVINQVTARTAFWLQSSASEASAHLETLDAGITI